MEETTWAGWIITIVWHMQSTYTGVYARGGPTNTDGPHDLSEIANRKPADRRGVAHAPMHGYATASTPTLSPRHMSADCGTRSRLSSGHGGPSSFGGGLGPSLSCNLSTSTPNASRRTSCAGRLSIGHGNHGPYPEKSCVSPAMMQHPDWDLLGVVPCIPG